MLCCVVSSLVHLHSEGPGRAESFREDSEKVSSGEPAGLNPGRADGRRCAVCVCVCVCVCMCLCVYV